MLPDFEECSFLQGQVPEVFKAIAHIGIAVRDLDAAIELFQKLFGVSPRHKETVKDQKVNTAMFEFRGGAIELLSATSPDSPIAKFIEKRGEGVHHISFVVEDIEAELGRLSDLGFKLVDTKPRAGAGGYDVAFLHPKSTNGVLIELGQKRERGNE
jgi:methylmalonyl-CoA/ethylmalonyl-CoA epimerase